ncbi:MAG: glycosyltransferase family 2 protein [Planctomycetota bacterium]
MTVSIVIPMRNGEPFIRQTLDAILTKPAPDQPAMDLEVLVVDDGSTDGSEHTVAERAKTDPRLRVIPGPCQGIAASLNTGIEAAAGEYLVRCDADDLLPPERLRDQADYLDQHPDVLAVCGTYATIDRKGRLISSLDTGVDPADITDELHRGQTRTHFGTYMTRTTALRELGGARPYFTVAEDLDLQLRLGTLGSVHYQPIDCYRYRLHGTSITHTHPSPLRVFLTEQAKAFAQQRAATGADDLMRGEAPEVPEDTTPGMGIRGHTQRMLIGEAWRQFRAGQRGRGFATMWRATLAHPTRPRGWVSLLQILVKRRRCSIQPLTKDPTGQPTPEPSHG